MATGAGAWRATQGVRRDLRGVRGAVPGGSAWRTTQGVLRDAGAVMGAGPAQ
ncbi:MAG: hypothetical protein ABI625_09430 [bacterium]